MTHIPIKLKVNRPHSQACPQASRAASRGEEEGRQENTGPSRPSNETLEETVPSVGKGNRYRGKSQLSASVKTKSLQPVYYDA